MITAEQWEEAIGKVQEHKNSKGIGTLGEKMVHAAIKYAVEPNSTYHEVPMGRYVADVVHEQGLIEVQTRNFRNLRNKLQAFLEKGPVTVIHPIAAGKWICWIDEESGEVSRKSRSPKHGQPLDAFYELYWLRDMLNCPGLTIELWLMNMEEYRLLNGWSRDKKRGASRYQQVPLELIQIVKLQNNGDYLNMLPDLPDPFTKKELMAAAHRSSAWASRTLYTLEALNGLKRQGKRGNAILYHRI